METYKELYFKLFGALADATDLLEAGNVWEAKKLLIRAMRETEAAYIEGDLE